LQGIGNLCHGPVGRVLLPTGHYLDRFFRAILLFGISIHGF
jgi:hypothetical protein